MTKKKDKQYTLRLCQRTFGVFLVLALWECNARFGLYHLVAPTLPLAYFPSLNEVFSAGLRAVIDQTYVIALVQTVYRILVAFGIAAILGVFFALLAARSAALDNLIYYPIEFFRQLPAVAVIPFAIMLFGIYTSMKVAVAVFGCFFPVFVATREGLKSVEPGLVLTARTYKWTGLRLLFGVMFPSAIPHILASFRITLAISLILVVMSEMLVGGDGLGVRIVEKERAFDFPGLYAETFLLGIVGVILNLALEVVSRRLYYWREDEAWRPN